MNCFAAILVILNALQICKSEGDAVLVRLAWVGIEKGAKCFPSVKNKTQGCSLDVELAVTPAKAQQKPTLLKWSLPDHNQDISCYYPDIPRKIRAKRQLPPTIYECNCQQMIYSTISEELISMDDKHHFSTLQVDIKIYNRFNSTYKQLMVDHKPAEPIKILAPGEFQLNEFVNLPCNKSFPCDHCKKYTKGPAGIGLDISLWKGGRVKPLPTPAPGEICVTEPDV